MSMTSLKELAAELAPQAISTRRDLHRHPEVAFEEFRTAGIVAERLTALGGLEVKTGVGVTGVVAVLDTGRSGRTVLVRADMDALPVHEERESEYRSTVPGKMHACGHDGHTAVLLAVAESLVRRREELPGGKVIFIFQPAEEVGGGAEAMLADGILQGVPVDASIGLHLSSNHDVGKVAVSPGPSMAATDSFTVTLTGRGGHAGYPHQNVDTILMAAQVITGLQMLVSRETSPLENAVISITTVQGGNSHNVIPSEVELRGTIRTFGDELRERLMARLPEYTQAIAAASGGSSKIDWVSSAPAVVNDPERTAIFQEVAEEALGAENVIELDPVMGSEDMSLWLRAAPGVFFWVGARNSELGFDLPHHHPEFDIDEDSLENAILLLSSGVERFLRE